MSLLMEYNMLMEEHGYIKFLYKLKFLITHSIWNFGFYDNSPEIIEKYLKQLYYKLKLAELNHTDFFIFRKIDKAPVLVVEVDGYAFHANNPKQLKMDRMKDGILEKYNIPILRVATNESGEEEKLKNKLEKILNIKIC